MSRAKSLTAVWRDALRDSDLAATPKLVGFVLSTYMNGRGLAYPGRAAIARGASVDVRTVERATRVLEAAGFLAVERSDGGRGRTNGYQAVLPETAAQVRRSEWETAAETTLNGGTDDAKRRHGDARKRLKALESVRASRDGRLKGAAARAETCPECEVGGGFHANGCRRAKAAAREATT